LIIVELNLVCCTKFSTWT